MKNNEKHNLVDILHDMLKSKDGSERAARLNEVCRVCQIPGDVLVSFVKEGYESDWSLNQLKYRIVGWMQTNKISTAHIE